jgi:hypothetical protein
VVVGGVRVKVFQDKEILEDLVVVLLVLQPTINLEELEILHQLPHRKEIPEVLLEAVPEVGVEEVLQLLEQLVYLPQWVEMVVLVV